jgi:outer membrane biosynthesis protein TonB
MTVTAAAQPPQPTPQAQPEPQAQPQLQPEPTPQPQPEPQPQPQLQPQPQPEPQPIPTPPPTAQPTPHSSSPPPSTRTLKADLTADDLNAWLALGRYRDITRACRSPKLAAHAATTCVISACKLGDSASAAKWFEQTPGGERNSLVRSCRASSIDLCALSPMQCRN